MIGNTATSSKKHHQLNTSDETRQDNNEEKLKKELNDYNPFKDKGDDLFNIVSKKCLSNKAKENIIDVENRRHNARDEFVKNRINGETNMRDKMTKIKVHSWNELNKRKKDKDTSQQQLNKTTALLSKMLIIFKSDRQLDIKDTVSNCELLSVNKTLMKGDGSLKTCHNKHELRKVLEEYDTDVIDVQSITTERDDSRQLIVDGMAVVQ
ncbi:hypothetical protein DPMN_170547 [Dreissena polymorpha]|uniref:Uncharacterized protein n=1 Tax=Dreissena polymorpha TaxID=45954 RepID=A0A9D4IED3_DREPO|nr:hypothetical protein DPMN_170547 [Dreissena polymorpha]